MFTVTKTLYHSQKEKATSNVTFSNEESGTFVIDEDIEELFFVKLAMDF